MHSCVIVGRKLPDSGARHDSNDLAGFAKEPLIACGSTKKALDEK